MRVQNGYFQDSKISCNRIESISTQPSQFLHLNGFKSCQKNMCLLILTQCISKKCDPLFSLRSWKISHALGNHDFSPHLFCCAVSSALFVCPEVFEVLHPTIASRNARLCLLAVAAGKTPRWFHP